MFGELIAGWAKAFNEIGLLAEYQKSVTVLKYATEQCFKLEDYTPGSFPSRHELLENKPSEIPLFYEEYGLDKNGLPCYCRTIDKEGQPVSAGFYRYTPEAVEFVRYNLSYSVPHVFQRMVFADGRKLAFLHAVANGGGFSFSGMTREEAIDLAQRDERSVFLYVKQYEYEDGRIVRDVSHNRAAGIGEYDFKGYYTYDQNGTLLEIRDISRNGHEQLRYCHWDAAEGLTALTSRLATELAEAIVNALSEEKLETPLAILQLSYHYADYYKPTLNPLSVKEKNDIITTRKNETWQWLFLNDNWLHHIQLKGIEKTFTQFMNQVFTLGAHDAARGMLQKTAALLTASRLQGRIPVDPEFFAYAIDNSIEGHDAEDFKDILLNCGVPDAQYEKWRARGWMRD